VARGEWVVEVKRCSCGGPVRWENLHDPRGERWLGICNDSRWMVCIPLDDPGVETTDPLGVFFLGQAHSALPPPRTPWLRFVRMTSGPPWEIHWDLEASSCESCPGSVAAKRHGVVNARCSGSYAICLGCGLVRVRYTDNRTRTLLAELIGSEWGPPDPAVRRVRLDVFALYRYVLDQFERRSS
jgi:hypothetical protein